MQRLMRLTAAITIARVHSFVPSTSSYSTAAAHRVQLLSTQQPWVQSRGMRRLMVSSTTEDAATTAEAAVEAPPAGELTELARLQIMVGKIVKVTLAFT